MSADAYNPRPLAVRVESFKPVRSNTLVGFIDLVVPEIHLRTREAPVHQSQGRRWVGLPGRSQIDKAGVARRDDKGKIAYVNILQFTSREAGDAFSDRAVAAVVADYPHAFDDPDTAR